MQYLLKSTVLVLLFTFAVLGQSIEDLKIFEGEWDGQLEYANFGDGKRVKLNARLTIKPAADGKSAKLRYLYDDFGKVYRSNGGFSLDTKKKIWRYDGNDLRYKLTSDGLVAEGTVTENNKKEPVRLTIKVGANDFSILKETRSPYKFRNKYTFKRADVSAESFPNIPAKLLQEDIDVLQKTLEGLHPALYRYASKEKLKRAFESLRNSARKPMRQDKFMARVSQFLYELKCYHTHVNPFNQVNSIKEKLSKRRSFLPFYFDVIDDKFIVTANASSKQLPIGSEIVSVNGVKTKEIIEKLLTVSKADGENNEGNRLADISISPENGSTWALFDIYFPIFFDVPEGVYKIEARNFKTRKAETFEVFAFTRKGRTNKMSEKYGDKTSYDAGWESKIVDGTGYLRMSNFITWKLSFKAKEFIANAFQEFRTKKVKNLIVDIRGNGGGDSNIAMEIGKNVSTKPLPCKSDSRTLIRTAKPNPELLKYTSTYEPRIKAALAQGLPKQAYRASDIDGLLEYLPDSQPCKEIEPYPNALDAKVFMIVDSYNSSAAYSFAYFMKKLNLATLVGQQTGGNLQGFNGGSYLFTKLPNSEVEFDIPVFGYYSLTQQPDGGVVPDVLVKKKPEDIGNGFDRELATIQRLISKQ